MTIPWNRILGEKGATVIKSLLLGFSNPMEPPIDFGIDYYCEMFSPPPKAFYVQAKGTQHFDEKWGQSINRKTIELWLDQIYPVYLIVYDENDKNCYWMSIEEQRKDLAERLKRTNAETIYLTMDRSHLLKDGKTEELIQRIKEDANYKLSCQFFKRASPICW